MKEFKIEILEKVKIIFILNISTQAVDYYVNIRFLNIFPRKMLTKLYFCAKIEIVKVFFIMFENDFHKSLKLCKIYH